MTNGDHGNTTNEMKDPDFQKASLFLSALSDIDADLLDNVKPAKEPEPVRTNGFTLFLHTYRQPLTAAACLIVAVGFMLLFTLLKRNVPPEQKGYTGGCASMISNEGDNRHNGMEKEPSGKSDSQNVCPALKEIQRKDFDPERTERISEIKAVYACFTLTQSLYCDAASLVEESDVIFSGKVIGFKFDNLMNESGPIDFGNEVGGQPMLHTVYSVDVGDVLKGSLSATVDLKIPGGRVGERMDEQFSVAGGLKQKHIIGILKDAPDIRSGRSYLFLLKRGADGRFTILNLKQSVYDLNPSSPPEEIVSAEDILSYLSRHSD